MISCLVLNPRNGELLSGHPSEAGEFLVLRSADGGSKGTGDFGGAEPITKLHRAARSGRHIPGYETPLYTAMCATANGVSHELGDPWWTSAHKKGLVRKAAGSVDVSDSWSGQLTHEECEWIMHDRGITSLSRAQGQVQIQYEGAVRDEVYAFELETAIKFGLVCATFDHYRSAATLQKLDPSAAIFVDGAALQMANTGLLGAAGASGTMDLLVEMARLSGVGKAGIERMAERYDARADVAIGMRPNPGPDLERLARMRVRHGWAKIGAL